MSAAAPILGLREKVVEHLKADAAVLLKLPIGSIYGEQVPAERTWPFGRYGISDSRPGDIAFPYHVFSKQPFTDECAGIVEEIARSLNGLVVVLDDGRKVTLAVTGTRIDPDPEETAAWHGIVSVLGTVPRDCDNPRD